MLSATSSPVFKIPLIATFFVFCWQLAGNPMKADEAPKKTPLTHTKDSLDDVKKAIASGKAVLIDVRELVEWKAGHVKGATHMPFRAMQEKIDAEKVKEQFKDKIVYTYCAVGMRSLKAGQILTKLDLDIRPLKPGFDELVAAGFEKE